MIDLTQLIIADNSIRPLLTVNKMTVQNDVVHFVLGFPNKNELIFVHVLRTKRDGDKPAA